VPNCIRVIDWDPRYRTKIDNTEIEVILNAQQGYFAGVKRQKADGNAGKEAKSMLQKTIQWLKIPELFKTNLIYDSGITIISNGKKKRE